MQPFYGRRLSRSISKLEISNLWDEDFFLKKTNVLKKIKEVKSQFNFFNLEIGFGAGDNSAHQAFLKKDECFIACDPYLNGLVKLKKKINTLGLKNIFISNFDFSNFFEFIQTINFSKIFILFPDPWPKKKHKKRRLISEKFVKLLSTITEKDSSVIISTDEEDYLNQILYNFFINKDFRLLCNLRDMEAMSFFDIKPTKYHLRAKKEKRRSFYIVFKK